MSVDAFGVIETPRKSTAEEVLVDLIKLIQPLNPQERWKVMDTARVWFGKEVTR